MIFKNLRHLKNHERQKARKKLGQTLPHIHAGQESNSQEFPCRTKLKYRNLNEFIDENDK